MKYDASMTQFHGDKYGWGRVLDYIGVPWEDVPEENVQMSFWEGKK